MAHYGRKSKDRLATCDPRLQKVFNLAIMFYDITIIEGHRGRRRQNKLYPKQTKVQWPDSKHNSWPSKGIDASPYPIVWEGTCKDRARFYHLAGVILGIGKMFGYDIRWGGNWDSDHETGVDFKDQKFDDLVHYEIVD